MFVRCVGTAIAGLLLTACAAQSQQEPTWYWTRANFDQAQFNKDIYECMMQSRGQPDWDAMYGFNPVLRDACMRARGYYQVRDQQKR